jgi:hypothetical protein
MELRAKKMFISESKRRREGSSPKTCRKRKNATKRKSK